MRPRILARCTVALAALVAAQPAAADERLADPSGVFAYVVGDGWVADPDGNGFAIRCDGTDCGDAGAWCETAISGELPDAAVQDFLKEAPGTIDAKVRASAGSEAKFVPTTPMSWRDVGRKAGFYGEYDLKIKGEETLKSVVLHASSRKRLVILTCFSDAKRLPMIREIVEKSELPS
ncbi:hypothetical protein IHQ68_17040 [Chelatococcus sambhunathii]|uniref:DUF1795 domain-containing protein n=1 Tax=Chelatococcus sambhunathii TaxID=363953 RepID=A0ABU1DJN0_9HYPH|nr:hypothetical protein [Chelatococcus sambhunathii]MDR4308326.1 hypothetical protein [Chelatococcus sambhunathii]